MQKIKNNSIGPYTVVGRLFNSPININAMSRKRLGKREREARKSGTKARGSIWMKPKGGTERVWLKFGKRKSARVFRTLL